MTREEYTTLDVEDYFNYMGMLAAEVNTEQYPMPLDHLSRTNKFPLAATVCACCIQV